MSLPKRESTDETEQIPAVTGRRPLPHLKLAEVADGEARVAFDHKDPEEAVRLLMEAFGTDNRKFLTGFVSQIGNASSRKGEIDIAAVNFMLGVIEGVEPRDHLEAMLAAQMAAVHGATMTFARRLNSVDRLDQQDSAERTLNKLARTFTTQLEALKRYRSRGEQTVRVEHVHVHEGGQAIVGNVGTGEGRGGKKSRR